MSNISLLIIDPQNDFMPGGALGVPGANLDMKRLSEFIKKNALNIDNIFVTLDSHHSLHISHPIWWEDKDGKCPEPFTLISEEDVIGEGANYSCRIPFFQSKTVSYIKDLNAQGKQHVIWPPHCLIGSPGHNVESNLYSALLEWEDKKKKVVEYIQKGENVLTEHFGAFQASVPNPQYEDTCLNTDLLEKLEDSDVIFIAGEASTHCVAQTVYQMMDNMFEDCIHKIVYLKDTCSPVPGFQHLEEPLLKRLSDLRCTITTTTEYVPF